MSHPYQRNLLVPQGTDYALTLSLTQAPEFRTSGAEKGATTIPLVNPLQTALSDGDKLNFGSSPIDEQIVTLNANAAVGDESLTVTSLVAKLERVDGAKCLDLTGYTAIASIWSNLTQSALAAFTIDLVTAPTEGRAILQLTDAQTSSLLPTLDDGVFLKESEVQAIKSQGDHYIWQVHLTNTTGVMIRPVEGFVVVSQKGADS